MQHLPEKATEKLKHAHLYTGGAEERVSYIVIKSITKENKLTKTNNQTGLHYPLQQKLTGIGLQLKAPSLPLAKVHGSLQPFNQKQERPGQSTEVTPNCLAC